MGHYPRGVGLSQRAIARGAPLDLTQLVTSIYMSRWAGDNGERR